MEHFQLNISVVAFGFNNGISCVEKWQNIVEKDIRFERGVIPSEVLCRNMFLHRISFVLIRFLKTNTVLVIVADIMNMNLNQGGSHV